MTLVRSYDASYALSASASRHVMRVPGPEVLRHSPIQACFKNDASRPTLLRFWTGSGGYQEAWFDLSPGESACVILVGPINAELLPSGRRGDAGLSLDRGRLACWNHPEILKRSRHRALVMALPNE
jgi:hypothetical protein